MGMGLRSLPQGHPLLWALLAAFPTSCFQAVLATRGTGRAPPAARSRTGASALPRTAPPRPQSARSLHVVGCPHLPLGCERGVPTFPGVKEMQDGRWTPGCHGPPAPPGQLAARPGPGAASGLSSKALSSKAFAVEGRGGARPCFRPLLLRGWPDSAESQTPESRGDPQRGAETGLILRRPAWPERGQVADCRPRVSCEETAGVTWSSSPTRPSLQGHRQGHLSPQVPPGAPPRRGPSIAQFKPRSQTFPDHPGVYT